ncbi:hypothetical protein AA0119_g13176 [Alternaria tenuissima]|uniref:Zinc/cadmium resistance protein n=2 Tax=Alternaria TaxID=5598 RepID=A0AB37W422_9PLEO|nr:hypothetical protein AA0115_g12241 [Alternaria tenuissima]RYN85729.1 hypothetical protein AA0119_g13176 [Alternaria tenuissima]RYO07621.1 hypothetical protein AA0121_g11706 [Alternaria tenuissima]
MTKKRRLVLTIVISAAFFLTELIVGFMTRSLALIADAIHYLNDLISFIVALVALLISERDSSPQALSFGWQRAQLLGSFFNGVFLLALGVGLVFTSIERFIEIQEVKNPVLVLIVACVGLGLNVLVLSFLHDHDHGGHGHDHDHGHSHESSEEHGEGGRKSDKASMQHLQPLSGHLEHRHNTFKPAKAGRDLGMLAVLIHVIGDAINNLGVIVVAIAIWKANSHNRFYADPAISLFIAFMLIFTSVPVTKKSGHILLESAPNGIVVEDVRHDIENVTGVESAHELHIWRLNQEVSIASAHVVVSDDSISSFMDKAKTIGECLHAYNIHSVTLQPELIHKIPPSAIGNGPTHQLDPLAASSAATTNDKKLARVDPSLKQRTLAQGCQVNCGSVCERYTCCN